MARLKGMSTGALTAVGLALAVTLVAGTVAIAATLKGNGGAVTAVRTSTADDLISTTKITPVDMPGMSVTVPVPSGQRALLVITFSGQTQCFDGDLTGMSCSIRAVVNGNPVAPGAVRFVMAHDQDDGLPAEVDSMQWVAANVGPGTHTVKIQWWVGGTSEESEFKMFRMTTRTFTVLRSKLP